MKMIKMKFWASVSGIEVELGLTGPNHSEYVSQITTQSSQWEELIFDFSAASTSDYLQIIYFNLNRGVSGNNIYYFDNIIQSL